MSDLRGTLCPACATTPFPYPPVCKSAFIPPLYICSLCFGREAREGFFWAKRATTEGMIEGFMTKEQANGMIMGAVSANMMAATDALTRAQGMVEGTRGVSFPLAVAKYADQINEIAQRVGSLSAMMKRDFERL